MASARITWTRDVLTDELLIEEGAEHEARIDDAATAALFRARRHAMLRILGELPRGFRIERVQGRVEPGGDPGAEYTLIDETRRPQRIVGQVARRRIGEQRITWTGVQLVEPRWAEAFACVVRLAATDAEGR